MLAVLSVQQVHVIGTELVELVMALSSEVTPIILIHSVPLHDTSCHHAAFQKRYQFTHLRESLVLFTLLNS